MVLWFERDEAGMRLLAVYVATLVREGVTFDMREHAAGAISVTLTGGF